MKNILWKGRVSLDKSPAVFTAIIMMIFILYLAFVIGKDFGGNINWLPMTSDRFGMPQELQEEFSTEPLFKDGTPGWDGQFYYYISNDILGLKGYSQYVDAPSYRWQRIGLPLIANLISKLHLSKYVSVADYVFANLLILGFGIYVFLTYLKEKGKSFFWIIPWCFSAGVLITLKCLLPDGAADAFAIIAIIMLLRRNYWAYTLIMSLACLTREGFAMVAFLVFLFGVFGLLEQDKKYNIKFASLLAVPGILFVGWYLYVTFRFGELPSEQAANGIVQLFLSEWPTVFMQAIQNGNNKEFVGLIVYLVTIIFSMGLSFILGSNKRIYWIFMPYILLVGSFGNIVMKDWSGYLKGISFLFALIPLILVGFDHIKKASWESRKSRVFLLGCYFTLCIGSTILVVPKHVSDIVKNHIISGPADEQNPDFSNENPLQQFEGKIDVVSVDSKPFVTYQWLDLFTPEYAVVSLNVYNGTDQVWSANRTKTGLYNINVGYQYYEEGSGKKVLEGRSPLMESVKAGQSSTEKLFLEYPKKKGRYVLKISLVQEGVSWFIDQGGASNQMIVEVK